MLASFGFRFYVGRFGSYDAIYGGLGAAIALLVWLFVAGWVFLLGAENDQFVTEWPAREEKSQSARSVD